MKYKKSIFFAVILTLTLLFGRRLAANKIEYEENFLWKAENNINYRVPGIVISCKGTIIAYCEMRQGTNDRNIMSVVYKRSDDGGETWSDNIILADGFEKNQIISDPIMVVGADNRIHGFYCVNNAKDWLEGGIFYIYSDDDGLSWSVPRDISEATNPRERGLFATGPGHGICLNNGNLIVPVWLSYNRSETGDDAVPSTCSTLYSTDNGDTWQMGETISGLADDTNFNESTIVELSDGSVMMIIRNDMYNNWYRAMSISPNGYIDWTPPEFVDSLKSPHCFGSLCRLDDEILYLSPCFDELAPDSRERTSIRASHDEGKTWKDEKILVDSNGGYSDLNCRVNSNGMFYALTEYYENNQFSIKFHQFNNAWLDDN